MGVEGKLGKAHSVPLPTLKMYVTSGVSLSESLTVLRTKWLHLAPQSLFALDFSLINPYLLCQLFSALRNMSVCVFVLSPTLFLIFRGTVGQTS